jgi:peroxiredoxin
LPSLLSVFFILLWLVLFRLSYDALIGHVISYDKQASKHMIQLLLQLSDNFGKTKTILLFVPLAFTGVCTTELCDVSASMSYYASLNAVVYGISVDSPFSQEAWAKQSHIAIPLLSDFNKVIR